MIWFDTANESDARLPIVAKALLCQAGIPWCDCGCPCNCFANYFVALGFDVFHTAIRFDDGRVIVLKAEKSEGKSYPCCDDPDCKNCFGSGIAIG